MTTYKEKNKNYAIIILRMVVMIRGDKLGYGGFPYFLFLGASDEVIIEAVKKALETGNKIKAENNENVDDK